MLHILKTLFFLNTRKNKSAETDPLKLIIALIVLLVLLFILLALTRSGIGNPLTKIVNFIKSLLDFEAPDLNT